MIYLDTHVVVWLYAGSTTLIAPFAGALIEGNDVRISPMVVLELQYLYEVGRAAAEARTVVDALERRLRLQVSDLAFDKVVAAACSETWTRDPFDRLIVAQARHDGEPLITKDRTIRRHYREAVWDRARK